MLDRDLLALLPRVRRARGFRLYLEDGRRLVDLWLQGGAAVIGHDPSRALLALKNDADRGLLSALPHPAERRLEKAVARLLPSRPCVRLYRFPPAVLGDPAALADPALRDVPASGPAALWRPWCSAGELPSLVVPVLPLGGGCAPFCVAAASEAEADSAGLPPSDLLSAAWLSAAARACDDLVAALASQPDPVLPRRLESSLEASPEWTRRGIYLSRRAGPEVYAETFARFLAAGFLLPPDPALPALLPRDPSAGEAAALAELLGE